MSIFKKKSDVPYWGNPRTKKKNRKIVCAKSFTGRISQYFFKNLKAGILVMTMPDLETFHIKRSKVHPVHYVYIFHSIVSTHMIYRKNAFDSFDTIFCVGKHHVNEICRNEKKYSLPSKKLVEFGYGKLEQLMYEAEKNSKITSTKKNNRTILVAPSWGKNGLIETRGDEIIQLRENQSAYIPIGVMHRLENKHCTPLEIIEIQVGTYLGEDDITRIEDEYSRN